ncbi:2-oxo-4-hydroxy-4-carboxy-5-ureidoimidazoline decarboxylase [Streptomyces brasiliscabiei]|uniref:2-oxo-4-hydroxy-4-carboxy-5-ureidoimidazoline decarboxylase n=1 Tax=Streptomyces brasiliscabiei TaxID=2736302 RepID=UPI0027BA9001|nr:2-oxo-4-hydroxy-4-carboxy-5-ureidoimidazoline decarboxylase [Streptomyces brasiliscabiei]
MAEKLPPRQEQTEHSASAAPVDSPSAKITTSGFPKAEDSPDSVFFGARDQRPAAPAPRAASLSATAAGSLSLAGRLDVTSAADIRRLLHEAVDASVDDVVLDLTDLDSWDATGLGVIMGAHRRARRRNRRLVLRGVPPMMMRLLTATRLHRILTIENTGSEGALPPSGLDRLNALPVDGARDMLFNCYASTRWAHKLAANRPYPDLDTLLRAADEASYDLSRGDRAEALAAEKTPALPASDYPAAFTALAASLAAYEGRFGHAFVACLDGVPPTERLDHVLGAIRARLANDPEAEGALVAEELRRLARSRLIQLTLDAATEPVLDVREVEEMLAQLRNVRM